jgi:beta propeller repeat protein
VAPRARLMALKGFRAQGETPDSVLARAMVYAADNGARVINNSWSCSTRCPSNPVLEEAQAYAAARGVVVVTSAGNRGDDVVFYSPKWRRDNIVVGASDDRDRPAPFTNLGFLVSVVAPGSGDFAAPGIFFPQRAILSTRSSGTHVDADGGGVFTVGGDYLRWAGTSMSAPHVSGLAALVLALHPDYLPDDVRAVIRSSARDLGAPGHDRATGGGLADAERAVRSARPSVRALFSAPAPGDVIAPQADTVVIRGALIGAVADAALSVGFGVDPERFDALPLAAPQSQAEGELARWDVAAREDGPYVLRLEVRGADGSGAVEFLPVSLERNVPTRISSQGAPARAPAISGQRVVWESPRAQDGDTLGLELFARDWTSGPEWRVVSAPGDQRTARLSGDRLAWLDAREHESEVWSCRLAPARTPCRAQVAASGPASRAGLDLSGDTLVWSEGELSAARLHGCRWRGAACQTLELPASASRQLDPVVRGSRLWWREQPAFAVFTCTGFPERCTPEALGSVRTESAFAASETRLAWWRLGDPIPVSVCRVVAPGVCPEQRIGTFAFGDIAIALSQHRVVWSAPGPGGDLDVYFCEDDPDTGACPIQRITGSAADQRNPAVSGTRVVWEDDRDGVTAVEGFELPSLDPVADRSAWVGQPLRIAVRGRDPAGGVLVLSAAFADGTPLAVRGAAFRDRGDGTGLLTWTPDDGDVGSYVVTFAGRSAGHLTTRTSALIGVSSPRAAP